MVSLYLRHNLNFFTTLTTEKSVQFYATFMTPAEDTKNFLRLAVPKNKHQTFSSCAWCVKSTKSNERTTTNYYYPKERSEGFNKKKVHPPLHTECVCKKKSAGRRKTWNRQCTKYAQDPVRVRIKDIQLRTGRHSLYGANKKISKDLTRWRWWTNISHISVSEES